MGSFYTKILEVNFFAFAYRLFHRDFSPINGTLQEQIHLTEVIHHTWMQTEHLYTFFHNNNAGFHIDKDKMWI